MMRTPKALIPYLLALAAILGGYLWYLGDQVGKPGQVIGMGTPTVGGPFTLIDQTGAKRSDTDFRGRFMLIYFGFANCPDVCPTTLAVMGDALEKMGPKGKAIVPIFITTDPARDTPPKVGQYVKAFGPQFIGLTGDDKSIEAVEKEYRVYAKKRDLPGGGYAIDHSSVIYLMGPDGKYVRHYDDAISPADLARDLEKNL